MPDIYLHQQVLASPIHPHTAHMIETSDGKGFHSFKIIKRCKGPLAFGEEGGRSIGPFPQGRCVHTSCTSGLCGPVAVITFSSLHCLCTVPPGPLWHSNRRNKKRFNEERCVCWPYSDVCSLEVVLVVVKRFQDHSCTTFVKIPPAPDQHITRGFAAETWQDLSSGRYKQWSVLLLLRTCNHASCVIAVTCL